MYENIGSKIKGLAITVFALETIASVTIGIVLLATDEALILFGLLLLIGGPLAAWVSSFLLYGFGELIDKVREIEKNTRKDSNEPNQNTKAHRSTNLDDTCKGKDVFAPKPNPKPTPRYNCINITPTGKTSQGMCVVCKNCNVDLEKCKIQTEIGTRTLDICKNCYNQFNNTLTNK